MVQTALRNGSAEVCAGDSSSLGLFHVYAIEERVASLARVRLEPGLDVEAHELSRAAVDWQPPCQAWPIRIAGFHEMAAMFCCTQRRAAV